MACVVETPQQLLLCRSEQKIFASSPPARERWRKEQEAGGRRQCLYQLLVEPGGGWEAESGSHRSAEEWPGRQWSARDKGVQAGGTGQPEWHGDNQLEEDSCHQIKCQGSLSRNEPGYYCGRWPLPLPSQKQLSLEVGVLLRPVHHCLCCCPEIRWRLRR